MPRITPKRKDSDAGQSRVRITQKRQDQENTTEESGSISPKFIFVSVLVFFLIVIVSGMYFFSDVLKSTANSDVNPEEETAKEIQDVSEGEMNGVENVSNQKSAEEIINSPNEKEEVGLFTELALGKKVKGYLMAQNKRDKLKVLDFWCPHPEKYYSHIGPNKKKIEDEYIRAWKSLSSSNNELIKTTVVAENKIAAEVRFDFTYRKSGKSKSVYSIVVYEFNEEGLLILEEARK
jgi:hypothetical protein